MVHEIPENSRFSCSKCIAVRCIELVDQLFLYFCVDWLYMLDLDTRLKVVESMHLPAFRYTVRADHKVSSGFYCFYRPLCKDYPILLLFAYFNSLVTSDFQADSYT